MQRFKSQLTSPLPEGWFAKESITLLEPDGEANVIASIESVPPSIDAQQYAETQGVLLQEEFPGYREFEFSPAEVFGGYPGFVRRYGWKPEDSEEPVMQIQLYYVETGLGYVATATAPAAKFERLQSLFWEVLNGLALELK